MRIRSVFTSPKPARAGARASVGTAVRCLIGAPCITATYWLTAALWVLTVLTSAAAPLHADDVHLTNGNTFEGVIATVEGDQVRIRLPHGEIGLPLSRVSHIDKADSALEQYLARRQSLYSSDAGATDWLELARWARRHGLTHSVKESALRAARLDPHLDGLQELLGDLGYVFDAELGRWMTYEDSMERRGFVYYEGGWVHRSDLEARLRTLEEQAARRRAERAETTARLALEAAIEARVQAEVAREVARTTVQQPGLVQGFPAVVGSFFLPVRFHGHGHRAARPRQGRGAPRSQDPPHRVSPRHTENVFAPPPGRLLEERDFGAGLGVDLPDGWGGAPGRLRHFR